MADTLQFEDVLNVMKENNPKLLESWKDRKINGAKTILDSKLRRKVVNEVRFKLRGGAQIAFIGNDDQEKLIKIVGGKDRAQKSLDYIRKMTEENAESLSDEDKIASEILTTSLEKYIKVLEARQIERNRVKKNPVPTVAEMQGTMETIDESDKTDEEKAIEKKKYMLEMQEKYKREVDILKHKLEGIRLKIADKKLITKQGEDGIEVMNFDAMNNLYEKFQTLTTAVYDYSQAYTYINETLDEMKNVYIPKQRMAHPFNPHPKDPLIPEKKSEVVVPLAPYFDKKKKKEEPEKPVEPIKIVNPVKQVKTKKTEEPIKNSEVVIPIRPVQKRKNFPVYTDGEIAYDYGTLREKAWMKREAMEIEIENGTRRETFLTRLNFVKDLIAFLPNRKLKESAIRKISRDEINVGQIYDITELGEIRVESQWKAKKLGLFDDYEDEEVHEEVPEQLVSVHDINKALRQLEEQDREEIGSESEKKMPKEENDDEGKKNAEEELDDDIEFDL